eukprot:CCRYP_019315-RA/>CCRYP_019315-RA protein AED:0.52 eAED:0.52 QI:0/0/0/1/1/1/2/0/438
MTICWHMDDLKVSHVDANEVTKIEKWLKGLYRNISVNRGQKHTYLGMQLEYTNDGKCLVSMTNYTNEIIDSFPEVITGSASTPAADHLFKVRDGEDERKLPEEQAIAQLLFLSGRARWDIHTAVAFLTTRVKSPDEDDWGKVKRVLKYLNGTKDLGLTLSLDNLGIVRWYVDASFAAHADCKGHTGAMMTLGEGAAVSFSRKQRTNPRSSTEGELIGVYDALPSILHAKYFLEAMGYYVRRNVLYQDNKSSIMLEKNGRASSSKRTKHINMRYFFIKDMRQVSIEHYPTKEMWADVLTIPKQGREFFVMRSKLMGCPIYLSDDEQACQPPRMMTTSGDSRPLRDLTNISLMASRPGERPSRGCVGKHANPAGQPGTTSCVTSGTQSGTRDQHGSGIRNGTQHGSGIRNGTQDQHVSVHKTRMVEPSRYAIMCMWRDEV